MTSERTFRQQEIVSAARKIITTKGIKSLTVREIADELNITDGALYRHFSSKNEIISLLIDDIEETLLAVIKEAAFKEDDPLQKLECVFLSHLSYVEQRKGTSFIVINEVLSIKDKGLQRKMFGLLNRYLKTVKVILGEGIRAGKFRQDLHLDSASIAFFGMIQSLVTLWGLSGYRLPLSKDRLSGMFMVYRNGIINGKPLK